MIKNKTSNFNVSGERKYILEDAVELAEKARIKLKYIHLGMNMKKVLTTKQYVVFYLKSFKKLKYPAIADIMGLAESTVRVHYHRARRKIAKL